MRNHCGNRPSVMYGVGRDRISYTNNGFAVSTDNGQILSVDHWAFDRHLNESSHIRFAAVTCCDGLQKCQQLSKQCCKIERHKHHCDPNASTHIQSAGTVLEVRNQK